VVVGIDERAVDVEHRSVCHIRRIPARPPQFTLGFDSCGFKVPLWSRGAAPHLCCGARTGALSPVCAPERWCGGRRRWGSAPRAASEGCWVVGVFGRVAAGAPLRWPWWGRWRGWGVGCRVEGGPLDLAWPASRWLFRLWRAWPWLGERGLDRFAAGVVALVQRAGPVKPARCGLLEPPPASVFEGVVAGAQRSDVGGGGWSAPGYPARCSCSANASTRAHADAA
jgi:hypothetical protein